METTKEWLKENGYKQMPEKTRNEETLFKKRDIVFAVENNGNGNYRITNAWNIKTKEEQCSYQLIQLNFTKDPEDITAYLEIPRLKKTNPEIRILLHDIATTPKTQDVDEFTRGFFEIPGSNQYGIEFDGAITAHLTNNPQRYFNN